MPQNIETKRIKVLTEYRNYLPPLSADERKNLETGIREHGILTPLVLLKGGTFLLDGHNRLDVAKKFGFKTVPITIQATNNPIEWILRNQLSRRNLSELVRDKLIAQLAKSIKATSKNKDKDLAELASTAKMSPSTLKRVEKQQKQIEKMPKEVQEEIAEVGTRRGANLVMQQITPMPSTVKLKNDLLLFKNKLISLADDAINLEEDGVKGVDDAFHACFNPKKLEGLINMLEKKVIALREERGKEIDAIRDKK